MWQQSGSDNYMRYKDTDDYVRQLNRKGLGGYNDWRLPTLEELASLTERQKINRRYIDPVFDKKQSYCWNSDTVKGSSGLAWGVSFFNGVVFGYDYRNDDRYVRLVRAGQVTPKITAAPSLRPTQKTTEVPKVIKPPEPVTPVQPSVRLRRRPATLSVDDVKAMLKKHNFFNKYVNKSGDFKNYFVNIGNGR